MQKSRKKIKKARKKEARLRNSQALLHFLASLVVPN
jgi:hypothetical protein